MIEYNYLPEDLSWARHKRNVIAVKILKLLGFSVYPCRIGGEGAFSGTIIQFTASAVPMVPEDPITAKR